MISVRLLETRRVCDVCLGARDRHRPVRSNLGRHQEHIPSTAEVLPRLFRNHARLWTRGGGVFRGETWRCSLRGSFSPRPFACRSSPPARDAFALVVFGPCLVVPLFPPPLLRGHHLFAVARHIFGVFRPSAIVHWRCPYAWTLMLWTYISPHPSASHARACSSCWV